MEEDGIKTTTSHQICCLVNNKWSTIPLYHTVNSVQSDEKCLIMVNVQWGCYVIVFYKN